MIWYYVMEEINNIMPHDEYEIFLNKHSELTFL